MTFYYLLVLFSLAQMGDNQGITNMLVFLVACMNDMCFFPVHTEEVVVGTSRFNNMHACIYIYVFSPREYCGLQFS